MWIILSAITLRGVQVEAAPVEAEPVKKSGGSVTQVANPKVSKATEGEAVPRPKLDLKPVQVAVEISEAEGSYVPFAAGDGWEHNEVLDPSYTHTDDGLDAWFEMKADGYGTLWAVYTGTDVNYQNDTVYVFYSLDGGVTWNYKVAIYSTTSGYHPFVARMHVDRVGNWVYITNILAAEAGGGSYYMGTVWVTRFQHTGGGNVQNLQTILVDPQGWGEIYAKCSVAPDGSGNGYVYLIAMDWTNGYADYYRSSDHGSTWSYVESLSLGTQFTDATAACPVYGGQGALLTFIDWDDDSDALPNNDNKYYLIFSHVTSSSDDWTYFSNGFDGFTAIFGPAAMGNTLAMPIETEAGATNFDILYFLSTDNGTSWTLYTWDNSAWDRRSLTFDATPEGSSGWRLYAAYWDDSTEGNGSSNDYLGSPYLWYTDDGNTWHNWSLNWFAADPQVYPGEPMRVNASEHWEITCPAAALFNGTWVPHVAWRRTESAAGGGDPWHSFPVEPLGVGEGGERPRVWFDGTSLVLSGYEGKVEIYDVSGKLVKRAEVRGEAKLGLTLKPGVYLWRAGEFGGALSVK